MDLNLPKAWLARGEGRRALDAQMREAVDSIPVMAWSLGASGQLEFLNKRWREYSGMSLEDALKNATSAVHPDDLPIAIANWNRAQADKKAYDQEMRLRRVDGEYRWFLVRTVPVSDEAGNVVRWYGTSTDIEDRKRAEQAVVQSRGLLDLVLRTLPIGVIVVDRSGAAMLANAAAKAIWGGEIIVDGAERREKSTAFWHHTGEPILAEDWASLRALRTGNAVLSELIDIHSFDGKRKTIENSAVPIVSGAAIVGAVVLNQDVTERVRAEKGVRALAQQTRRLSRRLLAVQEEERRHIARELHDEFGQLLAAVSLHLEVAKGVAGEAAAPNLEEAARLVQRAGKQVRSLALDLRPTMLETAGLDATLRWLAQEHERRSGVPVTIAGQANELDSETSIACFRVVQEGLTNSLRHADAKRVWVELSRGRGTLHVLVRDDGAGFDVAQALARATEQGRMGLIGMRERIEIVGGTLQVHSQPGEGTTIRAVVPVTDGAGE